ncbi:MAG: hypothetical protein ACI4JC_03730 [Faecalibacterium sp.]
MKRIQSACICQTLHFLLKDNVPSCEAAKLLDEEIANYKRGLERSRTQYRILSEERQADGSVLVKIIKQYNSSPVGDYLN